MCTHGANNRADDKDAQPTQLIVHPHHPPHAHTYMLAYSSALYASAKYALFTQINVTF